MVPATTRTSAPAATPTVPGFRVEGGSWFDVIWCDASVIPYASITGIDSADSSCSITVGGIAEDDERAKRRRWSSGRSIEFKRSAMELCMVGTPEYHVGSNCSIHSVILGASKPGVQVIEPPATSVESKQPTIPWMWNSGMIPKQ